MTTLTEQDTYLAWTTRAAKELKGKALETLHWQSGSLLLKPYYSAEELRQNYPVIKTRHQDEWDVYVSIDIKNSGSANKQAHQGLNGGATALQFNWDDPQPAEIPLLLEGIELPYIQCGFAIPLNHLTEFTAALSSYLKQEYADPSSCTGFISVIPEGIRTGKELAERIDERIRATRDLDQLLPGFRLNLVDATVFSSYGLPAEKELGLVLAWYRHLLEMGIHDGPWQINLGFGREFYSELCKFRIIAHLSQLVGEKYDIHTVPYLFGSAGELSYFGDDRYTNLLQLSTSAMSAIMGGANGIMLKNFSQDKADAADFVARITRNCQLVLLHESKIAGVHDPASGSYFFETMSFMLAEKAWDCFLEIEEKGGLLQYLSSELVFQSVQTGEAKP